MVVALCDMRLAFVAVLLTACTVEVRVPRPTTPRGPVVTVPTPPDPPIPTRASATMSDVSIDIDAIVDDAMSSLDELALDDDTATPPKSTDDREHDCDDDDHEDED
jgi:hypothetical protein